MWRRTGVAVLVALAATACSTGDGDPDASPSGPAFVDRDCVDFATQAKAQRFFERKGGPDADPHGLDPDHDGLACETRPCPCTGTDDGGPPAEPGTSRELEVVYVSDGDTLGVRRAGSAKVVAVRVLGIDAPEAKGRRECGSRASTARLERLLPRGRSVTLTTDPTQDDEDTFGRRLRYVAVDGVDVGLAQVRAGLAAAYAYARPPFQRFDDYFAAQTDARRADRGNWARCGNADGGP